MRFVAVEGGDCWIASAVARALLHAKANCVLDDAGSANVQNVERGICLSDNLLFEIFR